MRSVLVIDKALARRERALISRLEVGLADEGVRVAHAVPFELHGQERVGLYSVSVAYADRGLPFTLRQRATMLREQLEQALDLEPNEPIEIVHAFGHGFGRGAGGAGLSAGARWSGAWGIALELSVQTSASLVVEVWNSRLIGHAAMLEHAANARKVSVAFIAPDESLVRGLQLRLPRAKVVAAPWGVHVQPEPHEIFKPGENPSAAILADNAEPRVITALLQGIAQRSPSKLETERNAPLMLFTGADPATGHLVWRLARKFKLMDRLTMVPAMETQREPVLGMDALIVPGGTGVHRSLVLEALGAGLAVVAGPDPWIGYLDDDRLVARVQTPTSARAWAEALDALLADPDRARSRAVFAREWVRTERSASGYVRQVLAVYDGLAGGGAKAATLTGAA